MLILRVLLTCAVAKSLNRGSTLTENLSIQNCIHSLLAFCRKANNFLASAVFAFTASMLISA